MNLINNIDTEYKGGSYPAFVSLSLVKKYLNLNEQNTEDDEMLNLQIDAGVRTLETMTNQSFSNGTHYFTYPFRSDYYKNDQIYIYDVLAPDTANIVAYTREDRYKAFDESEVSLTFINKEIAYPNSRIRGITFASPDYDNPYLIVKVPQSWTVDDYPDLKIAVMTLVADMYSNREFKVVNRGVLNTVYNNIRKYARN